MFSRTRPGPFRSSRRRVLVRAAAWLLLLGSGVVALRVSGMIERLFYYPTRGPTPVPAGHPGGELVRFASADGTPLVGWFLPARGTTGGALAPTVLHVHGNAGNITDHLWFTEYLPAAGFNLFIFDYRGYGESGGRARHRADLLADTHAALDVLLARDDVDPHRIGLYAQSLGGGFGLAVMAERPELRAAVVVSAFASWRAVAADAVRARWRETPGPIARALAAALVADDHRPIDAIARIDRPLLLLHGDADTIVPVRHARMLAEAAPTARLVILEDGDHNGLRTSHPEVDELIVSFLRETLD